MYELTSAGCLTAATLHLRRQEDPRRFLRHRYMINAAQAYDGIQKARFCLLFSVFIISFRSGDLFSALTLAWTYRHPDDFQLAIRKVIATVQVCTIVLQVMASD